MLGNPLSLMGFGIGALKPENWAKIGCGSIGVLVGQSLVLGNPLLIMGLGIGGALMASGIGIDSIVAALNAEDGKEWQAVGEKYKSLASELPETLLTGFFTGLLIGGIRRAATSSTKPVDPTKPITGFKKVPNVAQYKWSHWSGQVDIRRGITLEQAKEIANSNAKIDYFFHMNTSMTLENQDWTSFRHFSPGDAVFFSGKPWWGSAPGMADGYVKI